MTNPTVSASLFSAIEMAPRDPILGITEAFNADQNPAKINLGVGVYYDDNGKVPLLACVRKAEAILIEQAAPRTYLPIEGLAAYDKAVQELVFGADSAVIQERRAVTVQAIGGTGALKIGADFLQRFAPGAQVYISDPSWENHRALFENAGFVVNNYAYYDAATHGVNFDGMLASLNAMPAGSIVVLHACCHNPTGADLSVAQWDQIISVVTSRGLVPFLDMAYQGFADGIAEDGAVVRRFADAGGPLLVSNSFSKSFSLYGERVGALSVVAASADEAARLLSQLKRVVRTNYSNPPYAWRQGGRHRADHAGTAPAVGRRTGRHARAHPRNAQCLRGKAESQGARPRLRIRAPADRHVLVLRPDQGAGGVAARAIDLRRRYRPYLRGSVEFAQYRHRY